MSRSKKPGPDGSASRGVGPGRPPPASRFRKGQSGNPKGRPRKERVETGSAFDIVIDRTLTLTHNDQPREVTVEEAFQRKTYLDAIAGNRAAQRAVLKMIVKREQWLARRKPTRRSIKRLIEPTDPDNAHAALLVLGIAEQDTRWNDPQDPGERLLLQPWAVQAALSRRGRRRLSENQVAEIQRCTRDAQAVHWPRGLGDAD